MCHQSRLSVLIGIVWMENRSIFTAARNGVWSDMWCVSGIWWGLFGAIRGPTPFADGPDQGAFNRHSGLKLQTTSPSSGPEVFVREKDIPLKSHFYFSTTGNFGNRTLSVDRADEIESIDSVQAKNFRFSYLISARKVGFEPFRLLGAPNHSQGGSGVAQPCP